MDNKEVIKEFKGYVGCFVECCESDKYTHQLLESVLDVIEDQEERIAIISEGEKHGHWIGDSYGYTCSACGKNMAEIADSDDYTFYKTSAYCPFCGAMMDEPPKEG